MLPAPDTRALPHIAFAEYLHWPAGRTVRAHAHEDLWQLDCFPSGTGTYLIGRKRHRIDARHAYLVPPGTSHELTGDRDDPPENLTVKFTHDSAAGGAPQGGADRATRLPRVTALDPGEAGDVVQLMRKVVSESVLATEEHALVASMRLTELLMLLERVAAARRGEVPVPRAVARAERFMVEHFAERLTLGDVASAAGVGPEYLCRVFRRHTGNTPFETLRRIRVERAKRELARGEGRMADVAAAAGFGSTRDLSRSFKRVEGTSPRDFRLAAKRTR